MAWAEDFIPSAEIGHVFFSSLLLNGYDELKTLPYVIPLICSIGADVRQSNFDKITRSAKGSKCDFAAT